MRIFLLAVLTVFATAGAADADYELETLAEGINLPWSVAFLPDGDFLIATRPGTLIVVDRAGGVSKPLAGAPDTYFAGQGGFFDVMLDEGFATNSRILLAFAHGTPDANATRVISATFSKTEGLSNVQTLFTVTPFKDTPVHYGGKLARLPDGTLLLTTGDGFEYREAAQDRSSLLGKIVRFNPDGSVPDDNPYADGTGGNAYLWSYGHRNPQGLVLDAETGLVYMHEHGPKGGDELNVVRRGENYGWPLATHGVNYSGALVSPFQTAPGVTESVTYWTPSIAPSGLAIYHGDAFPQWRGDLFVGALVDRDVKRLDLEGGRIVARESLFAELGERIRDVRLGPDALLYLLTDSGQGRLIRVKPKS